MPYLKSVSGNAVMSAGMIEISLGCNDWAQRSGRELFYWKKIDLVVTLSLVDLLIITRLQVTTLLLQSYFFGFFLFSWFASNSTQTSTD